MSAHWNRREFLKKTSAATLAALAAGAPFTERLQIRPNKIPNTSADTVIFFGWRVAWRIPKHSIRKNIRLLKMD